MLRYFKIKIIIVTTHLQGIGCTRVQRAAEGIVSGTWCNDVIAASNMLSCFSESCCLCVHHPMCAPDSQWAGEGEEEEEAASAWIDRSGFLSEDDTSDREFSEKLEKRRMDYFYCCDTAQRKLFSESLGDKLMHYLQMPEAAAAFPPQEVPAPQLADCCYLWGSCQLHSPIALPPVQRCPA